MKTPTLFNSLMCAAALTVGAAAVAQTTSNIPPAVAPAAVTASQTHQGMLSVRDVYDVLEKHGYRHITEIELDDHQYEAKAVNSAGQRVKLHVDTRSGKIDSERRRD